MFCPHDELLGERTEKREMDGAGGSQVQTSHHNYASCKQEIEIADSFSFALLFSSFFSEVYE